MNRVTWPVFCTLLAAVAGCAEQRSPSTPGIGSDAWYTAVDEVLGIADPLGHGPTPGSDEWLRAVDRRLPSETRPAGTSGIGADPWLRHVDEAVFWLRRQPRRPDWEYRRHLADITMILEVWAPAGTTPEGRWFRLSVAPRNGERVIVERPYGGTVVNHWVTDLDADGLPEMLLSVTSFGSGAYGKVILYEWDGERFLEATDYAWRMPVEGYMGHDKVEVVGLHIVRISPVYREGDSNSRPTGGTRTQRYKFQDGSLHLEG